MHRRNRLVQPGPLNDQRLLDLLVSPIRREILLAVAEGEQDVSGLARELELDVSTISRGLGQLSEHDLVSVRQSRRRRHYRLGPAAVVRRIGATLSVEIAIPGELTICLERVMAPQQFAGPSLPPAPAPPVVEIELPKPDLPRFLSP